MAEKDICDNYRNSGRARERCVAFTETIENPNGTFSPKRANLCPEGRGFCNCVEQPKVIILKKNNSYNDFSLN